MTKNFSVDHTHQIVITQERLQKIVLFALQMI